MNADDIYALKPGRDMDALIGEHVLGYVRMKVPPDYDGKNGGTDVLVRGGVLPGGYEYPPKGSIHLAWFCDPWSTESVAALSLLRILRSRGICTTLTNGGMDGNWRVTMEEIRGDMRHGEAGAVTLAWAVGMAALLVTRKDD